MEFWAGTGVGPGDEPLIALALCDVFSGRVRSLVGGNSRPPVVSAQNGASTSVI